MSVYLNEMELLKKWEEIITDGGAHASVRLGDGEATVAAHGAILTMDFVQKAYPWVAQRDRSYCGVLLPNEDARLRLVEALRQTDFLGILSQTNSWMFRPLAEMVLQFYDIRPPYTFYAFDNYILSTKKEFYDFFKEQSVLLVGQKARCLRRVLENRYGWSGIVGTVDCPDWDSVDTAASKMSRYAYRTALVSAGVPGKVLTVYAKKCGHVGIDFGCGTDLCLEADEAGLYAWEMAAGPQRTYICKE
ncbi:MULTISPECIES: GT-D fold domain-containing glycosyltransferase [Caproicibacterium]|uniref:GT-D fold-like domain-containing protein n=1 Tax=Caproicibacterium lactatifermentans TaxID=2666138 RepID=A0A859DPF0_9FIRM|nr:GT-D fold domain-containing glycosyltransferase [Caproicibacterium lactatifermentans]ARP50571.1 hypothetical protein B6259_06580 [Ruminococcaceae bacterium CPB6]QKN23708.1 hypothetical protein GJQ69_03985 [Caproicibacterium lactatifermentans]